jgi:acylphosphatase
LVYGTWVPDVRRRVVAHGRVQGVFFRDSTRRAAESRGVAGYARNRDDGSVECVFEGPEAAVDSMVEFVRRGPGNASVSDIEVVEQDFEGLSGFELG